MSPSVDDVRNEIARRFQPTTGDGWAWVREMFTDRAIVEVEAPGEPMQLVEVTWSLDSDDLEDLEVGDPVEVALEYVAKAEGGPRLAGPIVRKDASQHIAYSAVLVPGEPDSDGEELTVETVERVAHKWLEDFRAFDVQHAVKKADIAPVESYIEPADRTVTIDGEDVVLPKGTWTVAAKFRDDDAWAEVDEGTRTGLSIMGVPNDQLEAAVAAVKSGGAPALKRITLADVGGGDANSEEWFAPFIGVVDQPAVPKAKFFAFKSAASGPPAAPKGFARRLADALTGAPKEGRRFSTATLNRLKEVEEAVSALIAEAEEDNATRADKAHDHKEHDVDRDEVATIVSEAVPGAIKSALGDALAETLDEALKPINERLDKLDPDEGAGKSGAGDGDGTGSEVEVPDEIAAAVKAALTPITEKLDRVEKRTRTGSLQPGDDDVDPAFKSGPERDPFGRVVDA